MGRRIVAAAACAAALLYACGSPEATPEVTPDTGGGGGEGAGGGVGGGAGGGAIIAQGGGGGGGAGGGTGGGGGGIAVVDSGTPEDAGTDAGIAVDAGVDDGGAKIDAGTPPTGPGPWPNVPLMDYSAAYNLGTAQSVGVDEGHNIWLLSGARIGVLRPGTAAPVWVSSIGQAAPGFGGDKLATMSTVICGGAAGRAYVGYAAADPAPACSKLAEDGWNCVGDVNNPDYQKGDLDAVKLTPGGTIELEKHISESVVYQGTAQNKLGIRNTNAWIYDEDRSVFSCARVMKGPNKGDLFIGTNHGVTMIRGLIYNSHRHPAWYKRICDTNENGTQTCRDSLMAAYSYGLGFSHDWTDVLIANEWNIGIAAAPAQLTLWDRIAELPWKLNTFVDAVNSQEEFDFWRGFTQVKPLPGEAADKGVYYLASERFGLWKWQWHTHPNNGYKQPLFAKVSGLPTESLSSVQATEDGSVFVGTNGGGLWKIAPDGTTLSAVSGINGNVVKQLVYDPSVTPASLYVLTNAGLTVIRGH